MCEYKWFLEQPNGKMWRGKEGGGPRREGEEEEEGRGGGQRSLACSMVRLCTRALSGSMMTPAPATAVGRPSPTGMKACKPFCSVQSDRYVSHGRFAAMWLSQTLQACAAASSHWMIIFIQPDNRDARLMQMLAHVMEARSSSTFYRLIQEI